MSDSFPTSNVWQMFHKVIFRARPMNPPAIHPVQNMPTAQPATTDGPTTRRCHRRPRIYWPGRKIGLSGLLLASAVTTTSIASDINSLESITFTSYDISRYDWQTSHSGTDSASYNGEGPFFGVSASPSVSLPDHCWFPRCDDASGSATDGMVRAQLSLADGCGAGASASIVYRIPGASGARLTILFVEGPQDVSVALADGSWQCADCSNGPGTFEVPPGSDLVISASTNLGLQSNGIVEFVLQPSAPDEPAPFVVGASASASSCCIVDEIVEEDTDWTETDYPPSIPCGWEYGACGKRGCATFLQGDPDPGTMTWRSAIAFEGSSTGDGCGSETSRSTALLELVAPLTLDSLALPGGRVSINGVQRTPSDFPITLAAGMHTVDFVTLDSSDSARIEFTVTTDPNAFADCNSNGVPDGCDIVSPEFADIDRNWLPDTCQRARGDLNLDGRVDAADLTALLAAWGSTTSPADLNGDGSVNAADISVLLANWGAVG